MYTLWCEDIDTEEDDDDVQKINSKCHRGMGIVVVYHVKAHCRQNIIYDATHA